MENEIQSATPQKKAIVLALAKVQGAIVNPVKDTDNPFFKSKYADLASIWDSVRGLLAANDLAFVQLPTTEGSKVSVTGVLMHSSGESIESTISSNAKDAMPQSIGSCITYLRRYQLSAMLGIAAEDDDGNAASQSEKPKTLAQQKGPFSHGKPFAEHQAELAARDENPIASAPIAGTVNTSQVDLGSFKDFVKSGKVGKVGPKDPVTKIPAWTLYVIETEGHGNITTFSKSVYEAAGRACKEKSCVIIHCEPSAKGPTIAEIEFAGEARQNLESQAA